MKRIAILGSTGSIGIQALEVLKHHPEQFSVEILTAGSNADLLIKQAAMFQPNCVVIGKEHLYDQVKNTLSKLNIKVFAGHQAICDVTEWDTVDIVLQAIVGYAGLLPTIHAIKNRKTIALANKETLVVAGEMVTRLATQHQVPIIPIDSEHSAIFQCLMGEISPIEKLILTASGGPFHGKKSSELVHVSKEDALNHPNWKMGKDITINSATLMNKGFEVIEAVWFFDVKLEQIEVVVHPQSVIHSMVQFEDGSIKAQLGTPDMRVPIQFALSYPKRLKTNYKRLSFEEHNHFTFFPPDNETFPSLNLAYDVARKGGNMPCILNAANEVAVNAFLEDRLSFTKIFSLIETCLQKVSYFRSPTLEDYKHTDMETRTYALETIKKINLSYYT